MSNARWMAEIFYNDGSATDVIAFDDLRELHDIVEQRPNWNTIDRIVITLNLPSADPVREKKP